MRMRFTLLVLVLIAMAGRSAEAQPFALIDPKLFAFLGSSEDPPTAATAGMAIADQWLADEPFYNPATSGARRVIIAPTVFRVSRQDLRAENRNFEDNAVFFALSGAAVRLPYVPVCISVNQRALQAVRPCRSGSMGTSRRCASGIMPSTAAQRPIPPCSPPRSVVRATRARAVPASPHPRRCIICVVASRSNGRAARIATSFAN